MLKEKWVISFSGAHKTVERPSAASHPSALFIHALCCDYDSTEHAAFVVCVEGRYGTVDRLLFSAFNALINLRTRCFEL